MNFASIGSWSANMIEVDASVEPCLKAEIVGAFREPLDLFRWNYGEALKQAKAPPLGGVPCRA